MTTIASLSTLDLLAAIEPTIREHADASEREATMAAPVVEAIRRQGLFQCLVPRALGGREVDPLEWFQCVEAAARVDGSAGWVFMIQAGAAAIGKFMDSATAEATFGRGEVFSGAAFPFGTAEVTQGGYVVNGRWPYVSGCKHASFLMGFCLVHEGGAPRMGQRGPDLRIVCVPADNISLFDTWDVAGLSGTGSHDMAMEAIFVPEARALPLSGASRNAHFEGALYRMPFLVLFAMPTAAVALGIAQRAIDAAVELARSKVPAGGPPTALKDRPLFQMQLAEATALVSSGRAWLHAEVGNLWEHAQRGDVIGAEVRVTTGLAASNATANSRKAVDLMYLACGGSANYVKSPLQRCLRDIHAVSQHAVTSPGTWEGYGAVLAGGPLQNPLLAL